MRLAILENGHRPAQKIFLAIIRRIAGQMPGPILLLSYRSELFGKAFAACLQQAMRESTAWSVGEVELFAAFVSSLNRCPYCTADHSAVAEKTWKDGTALAAVLADHRTAPIDARLRTTLAFLEKLTLSPAEVGPEEVAPMLAAGVSRQAVEEAIYVATLFNVINRLADAFGFALPRPELASRTVWILTKLGYGASVVPG